MRKVHLQKVTIAHGEALSEEIDAREYATMIVICTSAAWDAASLGLKVSQRSGGTFYPFYREISGTFSLAEIASFAVARAYLIPVSIYGAGFVKLWSETSGSDTNQAPGAGLTRDFIVILKD